MIIRHEVDQVTHYMSQQSRSGGDLCPYGGDHQEEARASRIARATSRETVSGCTVTRFFSPLIPGTLCTARSMASR